MSISKIMEGSDERFDRLKQLLSEITFNENELATKIGASLALANLLTTDFFFAMDLTGRIIISNDSHNLGYESHELEGKHITYLLEPHVREDVWREFLHAMSTREHLNIENIPVKFLTKDGNVVLLMVNLIDVHVLGSRIFAGVARLPESKE